MCTVKWDDVSDFGVSEGCMICCYAVIGSRGNGGVEGGILEKGGYLGKVKGLKLYFGKKREKIDSNEERLLRIQKKVKKSERMDNTWKVEKVKRVRALER